MTADPQLAPDSMLNTACEVDRTFGFRRVGGRSSARPLPVAVPIAEILILASASATFFVGAAWAETGRLTWRDLDSSLLLPVAVFFVLDRTHRRPAAGRAASRT